MLKRCLPALLTALLVSAAGTKVICSLGSNSSSYNPSADQRPSSDAMQLAARVNAAVKTICANNCPAVALFRNATAANAMLIADAGQGKLAYSPQFFAMVSDAYGDTGIIAIIAHELGHALDDSLGAAWIKSSWTPELRADSWAGCALARSTLSPKDLELALNALAKYPSPSHPAWSARLPVVRTGYTSCGGDASKFDSAKH